MTPDDNVVQCIDVWVVLNSDEVAILVLFLGPCSSRHQVVHGQTLGTATYVAVLLNSLALVAVTLQGGQFQGIHVFTYGWS